MFNNTLKVYLTMGLITALFFGNAWAENYGPLMKELHHTVEEARIAVTMSPDMQQGTLTATLFECKGCEPKEYNFNSSTLLFNPFGAQRPIKKLKDWSGNRAMFHYRISDQHIEQIKILP